MSPWCPSPTSAPARDRWPFVVPASPGAFDAEALRGWLGERVAPYKRLGGVQTVPALPRSPSGKLLRRLLVQDGGGGEPFA
jgi:acyl-coenzyme A synthetase/AMP-(fatty) acid ligase